MPEGNPKSFVPNRLRELRELRQLSRTRLANAVNIPRRQLDAYEDGAPVPDEVKVALARVLRVKPLFAFPTAEEE